MNLINVAIQTKNRRTETTEIQWRVFRQLPHDPKIRLGQRIWGGKVVDIKPVADVPARRCCDLDLGARR